jgi:hypothetical protein
MLDKWDLNGELAVGMVTCGERMLEARWLKTRTDFFRHPQPCHCELSGALTIDTVLVKEAIISPPWSASASSSHKFSDRSSTAGLCSST